MTTPENLKSSATNFNFSNLPNKLGACSYGLFVVACFFPFMTIEIWGMKQSVSGTEVIDLSVIALMFTGMLLCLSGAPKWLSKGIAVCAIAYFYYNCFGAYSDAKQTFGGMGQLNDLNALLGGSTRDTMRDAAPSVFSKVIEMLSIGFWLILTSFISMKVFVFTPYTESTLWLPVKQKVAELINKVTEKTTSK